MLRFIADAMLGKLARWLRILGHDTAYRPELQDKELLDFAERDGRTLLTRDVAMHKTAIRSGIASIYVRSLTIQEQLAELSPSICFTSNESRCPLCNGILAPTDCKALKNPPEVLPQDRAIWRCMGCGKIYWHGGHWDRIAKVIESSR